MTKTIRSKYPAAHYWQAVLDLAFAREYDDHTKGEPVQHLSDYVQEIASDGKEALIGGLSEFFDGPIEVVPQTVQLTIEQRAVIIEALVDDWLETADRDSVVMHLMRRTCPVASFDSTDAEIVGWWADLGNSNLPGVDGTFE